MSVNEIHINDIGTIFKCTIYDNTTIVDISSATSLSIIFQKPDGTVVTKTATLYTDGKDGILYYTTVDGDLNIPGVWFMQIGMVLSSGSWKSNIAKFTVYENL